MKKNLKELKESYLNSGDITEVKWATENFGSYENWLAFVDKNHNVISMWRKELELRLKNEAYSTVIATMREGGKESLQAAKFLLQKGILTRDGTSEVTEEEAKEQAAGDLVKAKRTKADDDYLRLIVNK